VQQGSEARSGGSLGQNYLGWLGDKPGGCGVGQQLARDGKSCTTPGGLLYYKLFQFLFKKIYIFNNVMKFLTITLCKCLHLQVPAPSAAQYNDKILHFPVLQKPFLRAKCLYF